MSQGATGATWSPTRLKNDRPRIDREIERWRNLDEMKVHVAYYPDWTFPQRWLDADVPVLFDFDGLTRVEDFPNERMEKPPSVLRDEEWWSSRGARPDPLVCLLPNARGVNGLYFVIRREAFLDAAANKPEALDGTALIKKFTEEQFRRQQAYLSMRRGRRSWRF